MISNTLYANLKEQMETCKDSDSFKSRSQHDFEEREVRLGRMEKPQRHNEHELPSRTGKLGQRAQEN